MFIYSFPKTAIHTISREEQNNELQKTFSDFMHVILTYLKIGFCIYGGRWLGTFNKILDVNFCTVCGHLHIFNVLKFGNYVHIKLIKVTFCHDL